MKKLKSPQNFPSVTSNPQRIDKKDPIKIGKEIKESTKAIIILFGLPEKIKFYYIASPFGRIPVNERISGYEKKTYEKYFPNHVVVNSYEYPKETFENLNFLPKKLPHLSHLIISCPYFNSFKGIPSNLPNLIKIEIGRPNFNKEEKGNSLKNLHHFPSSLPSIESLGIYNSPLETLEGLPQQLDSLFDLVIFKSNLQSLEYLPRNFPNLKSLKISYSNIISLKNFPKYIPNLTSIDFSYNKIESLKYLPLELLNVEKFNIFGNRLKSFENLPVIKEDHRFIMQTSIRTFYDLTNRFLNTDGIFKVTNTSFVDKDWIFRFSKYLFEQSEKEINNSLCPYVLNLLRKLKIKIIRYTDSAYEEIHEIPYSDEAFDELEYEFSINNDYDGLKRLHTDYAPDPEIFKEIVELYKKSSMELAIQYTENPKSLTEGEFSRLWWEAEKDERKLLENIVPPNDKIFQRIDQRLSTKTEKGFNIYL